MNRGVRAARGAWLHFLGADDVLLDCLERLAPVLEDPRTIYYGDAYLFHGHRLYNGRFGALTLSMANICYQAVFYPRAVFERHAYATEYTVFADWALNMACFADTAFRFRYVPLLVSIFDDAHGASASRRDDASFRDHRAMARALLPRGLYWMWVATRPLHYAWARHGGRVRQRLRDAIGR